MKDKWKAAKSNVLERKLRAPMFFPGTQPSMNLKVLPYLKTIWSLSFQTSLRRKNCLYRPPLLVNLIFRPFPYTWSVESEINNPNLLTLCWFFWWLLYSPYSEVTQGLQTIITLKIKKILEVMCQELGMKTRCIFGNVAICIPLKTHALKSWASRWWFHKVKTWVVIRP